MPTEDLTGSPRLNEVAATWEPQLLETAQAFLRIPSVTGDEGHLAAHLRKVLANHQYDEVFQDELGNVVGRIRGAGTGPSALFTVHLDHPDPGDRASWTHEPFSGALIDGALHGCGASENKGALAAMVTAGALIKKMGIALQGDFIFAGVVQAQAHANFGIRYLVDRSLPERGIQYDLVVFGNPTNLNINLGQRGRLEMELTGFGRVSHAGAPWLGSNAIHGMVPVLNAIEALTSSLPSHPFLDRATLATTSVSSAPTRPCTIPDRCTLALDRRFLPSESTDAILWQVQSIINRIAADDPTFKAELRARCVQIRSFTGLTQDGPCLVHPFVTDAEHPLVLATRQALETLGQQPRLSRWTFPTDAGYTASLKRITTVGYAPGDEKIAQTPFEHVRLDHLLSALAGYAAISLQISA
ncbi:MAG: M20/M25/M40 family metallo-hydrolase [Candidatus Sericytochromatia bacterium]|nr:M20/M25/M40 family metallo-hydrolase [Candidatus Sericytochromatia bacterium]